MILSDVHANIPKFPDVLKIDFKVCH